MPELPEVQTIVSTLRPRLAGARIDSVELHRTDILTPSGLDLPAHLRGRSIVAIDRRAKRIVFTLDNHCRFYIHLGMSGRLTLESSNAPLLPHTHLVVAVGAALSGRPNSGHRRRGAPTLHLRFADPRRFGGIWWLGTEGSADENLGPEPLGLSSGHLAQRLSKTKRPIKSALLDQRLIAGLGNIYADESLFEAKIHPLSPADELSIDQVRRLNRAIKTVLKRAIRHRGSTLRDYVDADGQAGSFQTIHRVYAREGQECLRCAAKIRRIVLAGDRRAFCPRCQRSRKQP